MRDIVSSGTCGSVERPAAESGAIDSLTRHRIHAAIDRLLICRLHGTWAADGTWATFRQRYYRRIDMRRNLTPWGEVQRG